MTEGFVDELAQIHLVDLEATGLGRLGNGHDYLDRESDVGSPTCGACSATPPGAQRLLAQLRRRRPSLPPGDLGARRCQAGNFAFGETGCPPCSTGS